MLETAATISLALLAAGLLAMLFRWLDAWLGPLLVALGDPVRRARPCAKRHAMICAGAECPPPAGDDPATRS